MYDFSDSVQFLHYINTGSTGRGGLVDSTYYCSLRGPRIELTLHTSSVCLENNYAALGTGLHAHLLQCLGQLGRTVSP